MWATSLPSPTSDSPTQSFVIFAIASTPPRAVDGPVSADRQNGYPCCCKHPAGDAGNRIAAEPRPAVRSQSLSRLGGKMAPQPILNDLAAQLCGVQEARGRDRDEARRIERAFMLGAVGMACEAFSIPEEKEELFMMNVLGTYLG